MPALDELSYPIGRFSPPAASLHGIRTAHIETLPACTASALLTLKPCASSLNACVLSPRA